MLLKIELVVLLVTLVSAPGATSTMTAQSSHRCRLAKTRRGSLLKLLRQ